MNIAIPDGLRRFMEQQLRAGHFHNRSEIVRESLRLLIEQDALVGASLPRMLDQLVARLDRASVEDVAANSVPLEALLSWAEQNGRAGPP